MRFSYSYSSAGQLLNNIRTWELYPLVPVIAGRSSSSTLDVPYGELVLDLSNSCVQDRTSIRSNIILLSFNSKLNRGCRVNIHKVKRKF